MLTCTDTRFWMPNRILPQDCREALRIMRQMEGNKRMDQRFEFLAPNARPVKRLLPLKTPRVYRSETCTIAVTMLASYKPWDLPPDARTGPFPTSETATLGELITGAETLVSTCVEANRKAGWDAEGWSSLGIAVTAWQTGSAVDKAIARLVPLGFNGTAAAAEILIE
ncbi:MAG: hypothetical protein Q9219_001308 [cf. Caloplaca sp. 3 TL-2023]